MVKVALVPFSGLGNGGQEKVSCKCHSDRRSSGRNESLGLSDPGAHTVPLHQAACSGLGCTPMPAWPPPSLLDNSA